MTRDEQALLNEELAAIHRAGERLEHSYQKCLQLKTPSTPEELESIEAFTSRFSRVSDMLIQRTFRLIDELDLDNEGTVRDRINRAEKKGLIERADDFVEIRKLRNAIAHEYQPDAPEKIFTEVLEFTPLLLDSIRRVSRYAAKYNQR